jgi:hypothetical protein
LVEHADGLACSRADVVFFNTGNPDRIGLRQGRKSCGSLAFLNPL